MFFFFCKILYFFESEILWVGFGIDSGICYCVVVVGRRFRYCVFVFVICEIIKLGRAPQNEKRFEQ